MFLFIVWPLCVYSVCTIPSKRQTFSFIIYVLSVNNNSDLFRPLNCILNVFISYRVAKQSSDAYFRIEWIWFHLYSAGKKSRKYGSIIWWTTTSPANTSSSFRFILFIIFPEHVLGWQRTGERSSKPFAYNCFKFEAIFFPTKKNLVNRSIKFFYFEFYSNIFWFEQRVLLQPNQQSLTKTVDFQSNFMSKPKVKSTSFP